MRCILSSNIAHYHHLAEALHSAGLLHRYITAPALLESEQAPRWMPAAMRSKFESRRLHGVPAGKVRRVQMAEAVQRMLPATRLASRERADWANNYLFDKLALRWIDSCDVFHFVSSIGLHGAQKAKRAGSKIICDVRQEHPAFQRQILEEEAAIQGTPVQVTGQTYEAKVLREFELADVIVVPSVHAKRTYLAQGFAEDRLRVVPYGVDLGIFRPAPHEHPRDAAEPLEVFYAGSLTVRKGPQYLLEAVRRLGKRVRLTAAGPLDPAFQPILAKYEDCVRFLGPLPKAELQKLYAASSVFVLPSLADSFSLATLEAMACGTPVIVSENTGAADVVDEGRNGWVVPIRDSAAIRAKLEWMLDHPGEAAAMGARAAARAREMTWSRYGAIALQMYADLDQLGSPQLAASRRERHV